MLFLAELVQLDQHLAQGLVHRAALHVKGSAVVQEDALEDFALGWRLGQEIEPAGLFGQAELEEDPGQGLAFEAALAPEFRAGSCADHRLNQNCFSSWDG